MDMKIPDFLALGTGWTVFMDWLIGNMNLLQTTVGLIVGILTAIYTAIRIYQELR